jgi:hypothetical protein
MMNKIYLTQQYNGPVKWIRIPLKVTCECVINRIIQGLQEQYGPAFVGLYWGDDYIVIYLKPMPNLQWQIPLIMLLAGIIGGIVVDRYLSSNTQQGYSSYFNPYNPPGTGLSFTQLLEIGALVIVFGIGAYIVVNAYASLKRAEKMSPEEVIPLRHIRENVVEPVGRGVKYIVEKVS